MKAYDLYGIDAGSLDSAKSLVEGLLQVSFEGHDSSYVGEYFEAGSIGEENFRLRENLDPLDGKPAEMDFASHRILLEVNGSNRGDELRALLVTNTRIIVLRREML